VYQLSLSSQHILLLPVLISALLVNQELAIFARMDDRHTPDMSLLLDREPYDNMWRAALIRRDYIVPTEHRDAEIPAEVLSEVQGEILTLGKLEEGFVLCRSMGGMPPVLRRRKLVKEGGQNIDVEVYTVQLRRRGHIFHGKCYESHSAAISCMEHGLP
jgi:hypothetical protein